MDIGKIPDTEITNVSAFVEAVSKFERRHVAQWFFRGHSDARFKLVPGLFRQNKARSESFSNWKELETFLFLAFKREAAQFIDDHSLTENDWLCLAQHHRLPTRLLDWTTNSLIALFFAVEGYVDAPATVWCMGFASTNNCMPEGTLFSQRKTLIKSDFILFPRHIDTRIVNQGGCFTVHKDEIPLNEVKDLSKILVFNQFTISQANKAKIRSELYDMGIHETFIYPSLDSLASRLVYELTAKNFRHTTLAEG